MIDATKRVLSGIRSLAGHLVVVAATVAVTSTGTIGDARAVLPAPGFGSAIDDYQPYDGQSTCSPSPQAGVSTFRSTVLKTYLGTRDSGISRNCGIGGQSEHKEGRAWDWGVRINNPAEAAAAQSLLNWLLASDEYGNPNAMARRLGIMYVIWNRRIWKSYQPERGWQSYGGASPHTDHVHFSFSWAGAFQTTSWWQPHRSMPRPRGERIEGDFTGDQRDDVAVLYDYGNSTAGLWIFPSTGQAFGSPRLWWASGRGAWDPNRSKLLAGNFDGAGADDIGMTYDYGNATAGFWVLTSTGSSFAPPSPWWFSAPGHWDMPRSRPVPGDFTNDGRDDLAMQYDYGVALTAVWVFPSSGTRIGTPAVWWSSGPGNWESFRSRPQAGNFDAAAGDDIVLFYNYGGSTSGLWVLHAADNAFQAPLAWWHSGTGNWEFHLTEPLAGDFSGDGRTDIALVYNYGKSRTGFWVAESTGTDFHGPALWFNTSDWAWSYNRTKPVAGRFAGGSTDSLAVLYDYGSARTGVLTFSPAHNGAAFDQPTTWYDTGTGNWEWIRSRTA